MPPLEIELAIILRTFDEDAHIAEALFFPEVSRYGDNPETLKRAIVRNCVQLVEAESPALLFRRTLPPAIETTDLTLRLEPPVRRLTWRDPIELRLDVVRWRHLEHAYIAYIPALGIEVVSNKADDSTVERHVRAELIRRRATTSLKDLMMLERTRGLSVMRIRSMAMIRNPKQIAASAGQPEEKKASALEQTANDLTLQKLSRAYEVEDAVARLAEALTGKAARSVLLAGKAGVGKTAVFNELVRRRAEFGLASTPFWATSGSRLVAGMSGFGMWQERCDAVWREAEKTNAVVHFGNLVELMDTGKYEGNTQGVARFFRQRFMSNQALAVVECTPEQLSLIEREDPALLKVFLQFKIEEPSAEAGRSILKQYAENYPRLGAISDRKELKRQARLPRSNAPLITAAGLDTLDRLHRRYAGYSAYPGRPLRFLRGLLQDRVIAHATEPVDAHEVTETFAKETGLPLFLLDEAAAYDSRQTFAWFAERVIGQDQAIGLIVDLLATVKAGLTRPRRPIASLLFVGPTGVGKTMMAKSLARFFFGDEGRIARFDMSEYADALAVTRLAGSAIGGEGTLTARIREQPFSVVLFDEFEKAHASFFDLLLQTLGEGRLTDGRGRLADFSNSIVIMTSNLGAERFRRSRLGFHAQLEAEQKYFRAAQKHFTRAVQDFLRPEILNRMDHIVPFLPLARDMVEHIAERELSLIEQRDGVRLRGVNLRVEKAAVESLARRGYDSRYGARPLTRMIERELLLPLAVQLNSRPPTKKAEQLTADVRVEGTQLRVHVTEHTVKKRSSLSPGDELNLAAQVKRLEEIRRRVQRLERSPAVIQLHNSIWRLLQIERRIARAARRAKVSNRAARTRHNLQQPWEAAVLARLPEYQQIAGGLKELEQATATAEDEALLNLYGGQAIVASEVTSNASRFEVDLRNLLSQLLDLNYTNPNRITLAIYSENKRSLIELARSYCDVFTSAGMRVELAYYTAKLPAALKDSEVKEKMFEMFDRIVIRLDAPKPAAFLSTAPDATTGVVFNIDGKSAYASYESEHGLHVFLEEKAVHNILVDTSEISLKDYKPPSSLERRGAITPASHGERRRVYHRAEGYIEDRTLDDRRQWQSNSDVSAILKDFIDLMHECTAEKLIVE
jgi:ATP-dependent Clp protease ATP-binding subunit ClpA